MYDAVQVKCRCGKVVTVGELDKHEAACQGQDWQRRVAQLVSENEALKKENKTLKEELAVCKSKLLAKPAVQEAPKKRIEPAPAKPTEEHKHPPDLRPANRVAEQPRLQAPSPIKPPQNQHVLPADNRPKAPSKAPPEPVKSPVAAARPTPGGPVAVPMDRPAVKAPSEPVEAAPPQQPGDALNLAAMTIQRAFRLKKAKLRAALQEKRAERMQQTAFKKKRNEAQAVYKGVQQAVQKLNIPAKAPKGK